MTGERELAERIEELNEALRARDAFLAIAAHELRNPMHALLLQTGSALNAARRLGNDDLIRKLERVQFIIDRYVKRATTLLDVSRINAGHLELNVDDVDFATLVREVANSYEIEASFTGASLAVETPETLIGRWDEMALEQIVANLVSNAVKYGAGGPVEVSLAGDGDAARLTVRDHGIGIPPEDRKRIFERFEQVVASGTRNGFGVGLWLVQRLVGAHGGSITVDSTSDRGSTFTVRLPCNPTFHRRNEHDER